MLSTIRSNQLLRMWLRSSKSVTKVDLESFMHQPMLPFHSRSTQPRLNRIETCKAPNGFMGPVFVLLPALLPPVVDVSVDLTGGTTTRSLTDSRSIRGPVAQGLEINAACLVRALRISEPACSPPPGPHRLQERGKERERERGRAETVIVEPPTDPQPVSPGWVLLIHQIKSHPVAASLLHQQRSH